MKAARTITAEFVVGLQETAAHLARLNWGHFDEMGVWQRGEDTRTEDQRISNERVLSHICSVIDEYVGYSDDYDSMRFYLETTRSIWGAP
jgi:hypothetical protein